MKKEKKIKGLRMEVMPFSEISELTISQRVKKILNSVLNSKIVFIQGRLRPEEEARLIEDTMALVGHVKSFKGIELAVVEPDLRDKNFFFKLKYNLARNLIGDNSSITIVGPSSIIKEIKKDPRKIDLFLS